jgi:hypothetical protein
MTDLPKANLNTLLSFVPENDTERHIFNNLNKQVLNYYLGDTKQTYLNGMFYLGGQVKMKPDEEINLDKIKEVREINRKREIEYGGPCNSWEAASIYGHENRLNQMEDIIKAYTKIMYLRELEKTKLNDDVNKTIVSFAI